MRALATIRKIGAINPIPNAEKVEVATVDGWEVVVQKGLYKPNHLVVYIEVDAWVPRAIAPFLCTEEVKLYRDIDGVRLRTKKIRGQISQGLILPLSELGDHIKGEVIAGRNVTVDLGIVKYDAEQVTGSSSAGNFPEQVAKTDQERIQNLSFMLETWTKHAITWEVTEKLDGTSCTFYLDEDGEFMVCSRNQKVRDIPGCKYWKAARNNNIEELMRSNELFGYAIQGELIGEGIQKNRYRRVGQDFFAFEIQKKGKGLYPEERRAILAQMGIPHVPVLNDCAPTPSSVSEALKIAEGISDLCETQREGVVYKSNIRNAISFKAISNKFLLKGGE